MLRLIFRPLERIKRPWWKIRWSGGCGRLKQHLPDVKKGYAKNKLQLYPRLAYVCSEQYLRRCARSSTGRGSTSRLQLINCNRPALIVGSCTLSVPLTNATLQAQFEATSHALTLGHYRSRGKVEGQKMIANPRGMSYNSVHHITTGGPQHTLDPEKELRLNHFKPHMKLETVDCRL
jgi:hypothetical protein